MKQGRKVVVSHVYERQAEDWYIEPEWCSERLFEEEPFNSGIHDPCCGTGRIVGSALACGLTATGADSVDRRLDKRLKSVWWLGTKNFLHGANDLVPNVATNPPFGMIEEVTTEALRISMNKVAILSPLRRLPAAHWLQKTPLLRIWLLTPRPSMPTGEHALAGGKVDNGLQEFVWLIFLKGYDGRPETRWLHRDRK